MLACHPHSVNAASRPRLHRKRVTPDNFGINVHCLEGFSPSGIPVRQAIGAAMP